MVALLVCLGCIGMRTAYQHSTGLGFSIGLAGRCEIVRWVCAGVHALVIARLWRPLVNYLHGVRLVFDPGI